MPSPLPLLWDPQAASRLQQHQLTYNGSVLTEKAPTQVQPQAENKYKRLGKDSESYKSLMDLNAALNMVLLSEEKREETKTSPSKGHDFTLIPVEGEIEENGKIPEEGDSMCRSFVY